MFGNANQEVIDNELPNIKGTEISIGQVALPPKRHEELQFLLVFHQNFG